MSNEQVVEMSETIERLQKLKDCTEAEMDTLDKLWQLVYPEKTDWEYPGQVYRHVRQRMKEIAVERDSYRTAAEVFEYELRETSKAWAAKMEVMKAERGKLRAALSGIRAGYHHKTLPGLGISLEALDDWLRESHGIDPESL